MSIYLGETKVAPAHVIGEVLAEGDEVLHAADKASLNNAVNYRVGHTETRSVAQMVTELNKNYFVNVKANLDMLQDSYPTWTRPQEWPDLDSLNLSMSGDDYIYMTYDATSDLSAVGLHIEKVSGGADISCTIGHIANGAYVIDETITGSSNNYVYWFENYAYDYPVVRVTGDIKYCYCYTVTNTNSQQLYYRKQPILERIAYVPHLAKFCTSYSSNGWMTYTVQREKVGNGTGTALLNLYYAWAYGRSLRSLDISNLYTPNITDMQYCFIECFRLTGTLDLRHWNVSNVTILTYCFSNCVGLEYIDIRGWDTSKVTTITYCFNECNSLKEIKGINNIVVTSCTSLAALFANCFSLEELDLSNWNISNKTSLASTFAGCASLKYLNIGSWDTANVTNFSSTFSGCMSLNKIDVKNWNTGKATTFASTFAGCRNVKELDLSGWRHGTLTSVSSMFLYCYSLHYLDISNIVITSSCTNIYSMFNGCWSLKEININPNWDVSGLSNGSNTANSVFANCYSVEKITGIKDWQFYLNNSLASMFSSCYSLKQLDVSGWRVNSITSFASMFANDYSLENLNISNWNVQSATTFANMFQNAYNLKELNLSSWNTENCTTFVSMFNGCRSLVTVGDLKNWDTSKVTTMANMFTDCRSLKEIKGLSNWDVSKVTTINEMFYGTRALREVVIENWNLAACTSIGSLFRQAFGLQTLSLKNWSIPKITSAQSYFCADCLGLRNVLYTLPMEYNHTYGGSSNLTHESILVILNTLPTVSTTRTLTLGSVNINALTAAEKAIATGKGWTLAS